MSIALFKSWFKDCEPEQPQIQRELAPIKKRRRKRRKLEEVYLPTMTVKTTSADNPRKAGTLAYNAWELISISPTVEAVQTNGVSLRDLDAAVEKGYVVVKE